MTFKVQVGPPQIAIHQGQTVLISEAGRTDQLAERKGPLFPRYAGCQQLGDLCQWRTLGTVERRRHHLLRGPIFLTNRSFLTEDGAIPSRTLGLTLSRSISGGLHEDLDIPNYSMKPVAFQLEIAFRCDFADIFEVKSGHIVRRGRITTEWSARQQRVAPTYRNRDFQRAVTIAVSHHRTQGSLRQWATQLRGRARPGEAWHCCLLYTLSDGEQQHSLAAPLLRRTPTSSRHAETMADWLKNVVKIQTSNEEFYRLFRRAFEDMAALRLPIAGPDHMVFLPAAGLPWFVAPFGRDSLIVSLQNILVYPDFARGTLEVLGSLQAKEVTTYRDAEPGKILHELRYGELAHFKLIPHTPYYGTADATPLYLIALHSAWRATGDQSLSSSIWRLPKVPRRGSTSTAIATAMVFRNIRRVLRSATRTWPGRIPAMRSSIRTARW